MNVDMHSHIIPVEWIREIKRNGSLWGTRVEKGNGHDWVVHDEGYRYPLVPEFFDAAAKLSLMKRKRIDFTVLSPAPPLFYYWRERDAAARAARLINESSSHFVQQSPSQFLAFATVPMQDVTAALKELEYAFTLPGLAGVEIGASIEGRPLSDPSYEEFFSECERRNWPIFIHPYYVGDKQGYESYYFTNLIGNPLDTTLASASLIFSGVLDRHPRLRILLAHGGGYLPYQIGRLDHGYEVRSESRTCTHPPSSYLHRFFYDTITFHDKALGFLMHIVGSDRVVLGTDDPFDMSEAQPVQRIGEVLQENLGAMNRICQRNAEDLLGRMVDRTHAEAGRR